jgi:ATP-dependent Clp protease protease subunit
MSGLEGQATDIDIYAREILRMRDTLNEVLAEATGQPMTRIARDVDRDYILEPGQAVEYGLIDRIITDRRTGVRERVDPAARQINLPEVEPIK